MEPDADKMLQPFHVRNLRSSSSLVRVTAPTYDQTLLNNPQATLKYEDDDGDVVTVGSSLELVQHLDDTPSQRQHRPLSTTKPALLPPDLSAHRVFSIDNKDEIQRVWQTIQSSSRVEAPKPELVDKKRHERNDHQNYDKAPPANSKSSVEDRRSHYFNTTNPPQLGGSTNPPQLGGSTNPKRILNYEAEEESVSPAANLTFEGRRQAQLAGERFRARGMSSRHRKMSAGPADRSSYHNRWASYKTSEAPRGFHWTDVAVSSTRTPKYSLQAQNTGDRLRSRTTRMRQTGKTFEESSIPVDSLCLESHDSRDFGDAIHSSHPDKAACTVHNRQTQGQSSLLEVFEAELAKDSSSRMDDPSKSAAGFLTNAFNSHLEQLSFDNGNQPANSMPTRVLPQTTDPCTVPTNIPNINASTEVKKHQNISADFLSLPQHVSSANPIEDGITTAVGGFETCLRGIATTLKAVQSPSKSDKQIFEETMMAFQRLVGDLATFAPFGDGEVSKTQSAATGEDRNSDNLPHYMTEFKAPKPPQSPTRDELLVDTAPGLLLQTLPTSITAASRANKQQLVQELDHKVERKSKMPLPAISSPVDTKVSEPFRTTAPQLADERQKRRQLCFNEEILGKTRNFLSDFGTGPFQYHRPGPIHLPTPQIRNELEPKNSECIDHLRRYSSVDTLRKPARRDRSASPAITTRFPTVAQFENTNFSSRGMPKPALAPLIDLEPEAGVVDRQPSQSVPRNMTGPPSIKPDHSGDSNLLAQLNIPNPTSTSAESSGQFFNRMTGVGASDGSGSKARLARPFNAFEDMAQRDDGIRRSNTVAASTYRPQPNLRRPYSEIFSGSGRVPWESFTSQPKNKRNARPFASASSTSLPMPRYPMAQLKPSRWDELSANNLGTGVAGESTSHDARISLRPHDIIAVRKCVDRLTELGFGIERSRLRVYASASNGNLDDALDMIFEEQQAYEHRQ